MADLPFLSRNPQGDLKVVRAMGGYSLTRYLPFFVLSAQVGVLLGWRFAHTGLFGGTGCSGLAGTR